MGREMFSEPPLPGVLEDDKLILNQPLSLPNRKQTEGGGKINLQTSNAKLQMPRGCLAHHEPVLKYGGDCLGY